MKRTNIPANLLIALVLGIALQTDSSAQDKTKDGNRLAWDHSSDTGFTGTANEAIASMDLHRA